MMKTRKDIDGGWAWLVAFGVFLTFLLLGGFSRSFGILYASFLEMFGESASTTSLIPAVRTACPILIGPISTTLSERYTERKVVIAGSLLISTGFIISFFASSLNYLIVSIGLIPGPISTTLSERYTERKVVIAGSLLISTGFIISFFASSLNYLIVSLGLIPGIGMALLIPPCNVAMGKYFRRLRSRVYSLTSCGVCLGLVTVPLLLTYLMDTFSIRGTLLIYGGICLNLVITGQVLCPILVIEDGVKDKGKEMQEILARSESKVPHDLKPTEETASNFPVNNTHAKSDKKYADELKPCKFINVETDGTKLSDSNEITLHTIKQVGGTLIKVSNTDLDKNVQPNRDVLEMKVTTEYKEEESQPLVEIREDTSLKAETSNSERDTALKSSSAASPQRSRTSGVIRTLKTILTDLFDMTLMKNYVYLIFLFSASLSDITYANQSIYLVPLIESRGISREKAAIILSIMGGCDVIGRLVSGFLADKRPLLPQHVMCVNGVIAGLSCCFFPLAHSYGHFITVSAIFALVSSAPTLLIMPALAESVGVASLARGLGLGMFFRGISTAISMPLFGLVKDVTGSYDVIFPVIGCIQIVGGAVLLLEPIAKRLMYRRLAKEIEAK